MAITAPTHAALKTTFARRKQTYKNVREGLQQGSLIMKVSLQGRTSFVALPSVSFSLRIYNWFCVPFRRTVLILCEARRYH